MKKKRNIIIIIAIVLILAITGVLYFVFTNQDKDSTLTLVEKQWIESNKNKVIDFGIVNNIAILNNSGEGLLFDFFEAIEEDTSLEFNKISYEYGEAVNEEYAFKVVDKVLSPNEAPTVLELISLNFVGREPLLIKSTKLDTSS